MKVINYFEVERKENPHGVDVRVLYDHENAQAVHITLEPGESLKLHKTPVDVFFYILEGTPTVIIGEESAICQTDQLIESPAHIPHSIANPTNKRVRVLVVKAPRPTAKSQIL